MNLKKEFPYILIAVFISCLPAWYWFSQNNAYPQNDAGFYMTQTQEMFTEFYRKGYFKGFLNLFTSRGWKPIIFPVLAVPYLYIAKASAMLAQEMFCLSVLGALALNIYRFARTWLDIPFSVIGAILVCTSTTIFVASLSFVTELIFCLFLLVTFIEFLNLNLSDKKSVLKFTFPFAFCFLLRPVETCIYFGPIIIWFFIQLYRNSGISKKFIAFEMTSIVLLGLFLSSWGWLNQGIPFNIFSILVMILPQILGLYLFRKNITESNLSLSIAITYSVIFFWYGNYTGHLWNWIYETTFGNLAIRTGGRNGISFIESLTTIVNFHGYIAFYLFLALSIFILIKTKAQHFKENSKVYFYALAIFLIPLTLGFLTKNGYPAYYSFGFMMFYLMGYILLMKVKGPLFNLTFSFVILFSYTHMLAHFFHSRAWVHPFHYVLVDTYPSPHPHDVTLELIEELKEWKNFGQPDANIYHLQTVSMWAAANPFTLNVIKKERGILTEIQTVGTTVFMSDSKSLINAMNEKSLVLYGPLEYSADKSFAEAPAAVTEFERMIKENKLADVGLKELRRVTLKKISPTRSTEDLTYVMIVKAK